MADQSNSGLMGIDPALVMNVGLGLMSAARYGGNIGDSVSQSIGNWQNQKVRQQQYQMGQIELLRQKMMLGGMQQAMGGTGPQQAAQGPQVPQQGPMPQPAPQGPMPAAAPSGPMPQGAPTAPQGPQPSPMANFMQPPNIDSIYGAPVQGVKAPLLRMFALGSQNPTQALSSLQDEQRKTAALQAAPQIAKADTVVKSDDPVRDIKADPELGATWQHYATARGLDATKDLNADTARQVFAGVGNAYRVALGQPEQSPPEIWDPTAGAYGYRGQKSRITGEEKQIQGRDLPTYGAVGDRFDPASGTTNKVYAQTGGWGAFGGGPGSSRPPAPNASRTAATAPTAGNTGGAREAGSFNLGMPAPTDKDFNAAKNAQLMQTSQKAMQALDSKGFDFSPKARTIILQALTNESTSNVEQFGIQEALKHGLSTQEQTYMTALTPFLQAAGHAWGQAGIGRLTPTMARQMFETIAPFDARNKDAMSNMADNRQNLYVSALAETGAARNTPLYKNTIGADYDRLAANGGLQPKQFPLPKNRVYNPQTGKIE